MTGNQKQKSDFEETSKHLEHKKKAIILQQQKKKPFELFDEYGFDDEDEAKDYQRYIK